MVVVVVATRCTRGVAVAEEVLAMVVVLATEEALAPHKLPERQPTYQRQTQ